MERKMIAKKPTKLAGEAAIASHAWKRMDRMTVMGLTLRKLMELKNIQNPVLTYAAASVQAGKGSHKAEVKTDAAHNLPRDLVVNGTPFWQLADGVTAHARVKVQLTYSSAATMTVPRESNYLDSRWEQAGLPDDWLAYLRACAHTAGTGGGALGAIVALGRTFKQDCQHSLAQVIAEVRQRSYFKRHEDEMIAIFDIYTSAVGRYDPGPRLDRMWQIYQLPQYS
jgi:hypothetical protein